MRQYLSQEYCENNRTKPGKIRCPSCLGNDMWYTPRNATTYCFECSASFGVGDEDAQRRYIDRERKLLDVHEIRRTYAIMRDFYRDSLLPEHRLYLANRGIDQYALDMFQIGFCPPVIIPHYKTKGAKEAGLYKFDGTPFLSDRIVFPYLANDEVTDMRGRMVVDNQDEPRYKSPYHGSAMRGAIYPYNYDRAIQKARKKGYLMITEGEIKAILGDLHGFPIMALPGMSTWRPGLILEPGLQFVVIFDNSAKEEDRIRVDHAIYKLSHNIPYFSVATLPLLGQQKMDVDAYLLHSQGGPQRLERLVEGAVPYTRYKKLRRF